MKYPRCKGTGIKKVYDKKTNAYLYIPCATCHETSHINETGHTNQTNEEWFNGLSTIKKAKALHKLYWEMQNHFEYCPDEEDYVEEYCLCWLKTVHRDD